MEASARGHIEVVQYLCENNANVDAADSGYFLLLYIYFLLHNLPKQISSLTLVDFYL